DVNRQLPVAGIRLPMERDGVVEILGVDWADGDDELLGEILSTGEIVFAEFERLLAGLGGHFLRELVGDAARSHDGRLADFRVTSAAEDFGDDPLSAFQGRRESHHLDDNLVVRPHSFHTRVRYFDTMREHLTIDADKTGAVAFEVGADELTRGPANDFRN